MVYGIAHCRKVRNFKNKLIAELLVITLKPSPDPLKIEGLFLWFSERRQNLLNRG